MQGRNEIMVQSLQRDVKYHEEKHREYEKKIRQMEHHMAEEIDLKERARLNLQVSIYLYNILHLNIYSILC